MPKSSTNKPTPRQKAGTPGPKNRGYGNSLGDRSWIEEMYAAGELLDPNWDEKPDGFLDDPIYQWIRMAEEVETEYFEHFRHHASIASGLVCRGTAFVRDQRGGYVIDPEWHRIRRQCLNPPMRGASVCQTHGGLIPNVRAAAAARLAMASETMAQRLINLTNTKDENDNPIEHADRIKALNSALDRAGIRAGVEVDINTPGYKKILEDLFGDDSNAE
jgi:hypothetical protein